MIGGYREPLYLLPFDHRQSYVSGLFDWSPPLNENQQRMVADSKQVIYEGFQRAIEDGVPRAAAALLVDEEFGAAIQRDAHARGFNTVLPVEHSGVDEFEFEYGDDYPRHVEEFDPAFAKVLVRYNPGGDAVLNRRQAAKLAQFSAYCEKTKRRFMFELLVPATPAQLEKTGKDKQAYDANLRPALVGQAIRALQEAGVEPDVWKIEGLERREDCQQIAATAQRDGRDGVSCIVLGRGADEAKVVQWLKTAAGVPGFVGFAVGRTSFWDALVEYRAKKIARAEAAHRIAQRYREWMDIFEGTAPA
jgi:myo-inositol catabolism protein IolC